MADNINPSNDFPPINRDSWMELLYPRRSQLEMYPDLGIVPPTPDQFKEWYTRQRTPLGERDRVLFPRENPERQGNTSNYTASPVDTSGPAGGGFSPSERPTFLPGGSPEELLRLIGMMGGPQVQLPGGPAGGGFGQGAPGVESGPAGGGFTPSPTYDPEVELARAVYKKQYPHWMFDPERAANRKNIFGKSPLQSAQRPYDVYTKNDMWDRLAKKLPKSSGDFVQLLKDANAATAHYVIDPQHNPDLPMTDFEKAMKLSPILPTQRPERTIAYNDSREIPGIEGMPNINVFGRPNEDPSTIVHEYTHSLSDVLNSLQGKKTYDPSIMGGGDSANDPLTHLLSDSSHFPEAARILSGYNIGRAMKGSDKPSNMQEIPTLIAEANFALNNLQNDQGGRFADYQMAQLGSNVPDYSGETVKKKKNLSDLDREAIAEAYANLIANVQRLVAQGYRNPVYNFDFSKPVGLRTRGR